MKFAILSAVALGLFSVAPESAPQGGGLVQTTGSVSPQKTGFVALTSYDQRFRLMCDKHSGGTYDFRVFNYAPGALGTQFPQEHPTYKTVKVASAAFIVNGIVTMFTPNANGELIAKVQLPQSGSGHSIEFVALDARGSRIYSELMFDLFYM